MTRATIATDLGDIEVDLFDRERPEGDRRTSSTSPSKGFYDDVIFHRVIPGFVAQAGDGQYGKKSSLERGPRRDRRSGLQVRGRAGHRATTSAGALAMANAGPNTNGCQFFICHQDLTGKLPKNYTMFGQVTKGMDVVDKIVGAPRNGRDLPDEPVAMTSVTILEDEA